MGSQVLANGDNKVFAISDLIQQPGADLSTAYSRMGPTCIPSDGGTVGGEDAIGSMGTQVRALGHKMGSSEPLPIEDGDRRRKKKRRARAADSLPGKFEGWSHKSPTSGPAAYRV
ncbi:hypothetical protein P7K49_016192 [Saguinus oedipus]|uniref:Uncharacterized protein n=1 Tax=Saguinus oedipus TaxID=9490 RepID=A0ABQ9VBE0_SAGOE|nr:hypothetical protein P7K49_016192 [Saguinus oedipus]